MKNLKRILYILFSFLGCVFSSYAQIDYKERFGQHVLIGENEIDVLRYGISFDLTKIETGNQYIKIAYQYTNNTTDSAGVFIPNESDVQSGILDVVMNYNDGIQEFYKPLNYTSDLSRILFLKNQIEVLAPHESFIGTFLIKKNKTLLIHPSFKLRSVRFEFNFDVKLISEYHRIYAPKFIVSNTLMVQTSKGRR